VINAATRWINRPALRVASYDKAIAIDPASDDAWNKRGVSLHHLGWYSEAVTAHDEAIAINPVSADAWKNRGYALGNLGRYDDALASFDEAIAVSPDDPNVWYARGFCSIRWASILMADSFDKWPSSTR
jgi:tetratricopeptide (TPR) repeat protein